MKSADAVSGEILNLAVAASLALISFLITATYPAKVLSKFLGVDVPFLGIAVLGGFIFIFWISIAYRILGKNFGIITALLIASFSLLVTPWFGITDPPWFGVYGLISFFLMGLLTERINGGFGNFACLMVNWLALGYHYNVYPPLHLAISFAVVSFISGFVGDKLAYIVSKRILYRIAVKTLK